MKSNDLRVELRMNKVSKITETIEMGLGTDTNDQLQIIKKFAASLSDKNTIDEILWDVARNVISKLGFIDCVVYLADPENEVLMQKAAYGPKSPKANVIESPVILPYGKGIVGKVALTAKSQIVDDVTVDPDYFVDDEARASEITVPIILHGEVIGVIDSEHSEKGFFNEDHLCLLETIASIIGSKLMLLKAHDTLKSQTRDLQIINSQYRQSAFVISHDVKSPLANIQGLIDIYKLNQKSGNVEENDYIISLIQSSVKKLESKVDDLNQVLEARSEPSKSAKLISFSKTLHNIKTGIMLDLRKNKVIVEEDFSAAPEITYPPSYLESIMLNLLTNAIKYRSLERDPHIKIKTVVCDSHIVLSVEDNGIGIDLNKNGHKLFGMFQRFHRKVEGKGLGLNIVKSQIESLGGKVEVDSELGRGSIFIAYLKDLNPILIEKKA